MFGRLLFAASLFAASLFAASLRAALGATPSLAAEPDPVDIDSDAPPPCRWVALETREATVSESARSRAVPG